METIRSSVATQMLLEFLTTPQTYTQTLPWYLLGTHKINGKELRAMQRGQIHQGVENAGATLASVFRIPSSVKAIRLRPYVIATGDPSGVTLSLGLGVYGKFHGDKQGGGSQGISASVVEDTAIASGMRATITLTAEASALESNLTVNPFTGEAWGGGLTADGPYNVYAVTAASLVTGPFGRLLSLEGFDSGYSESGYILLDPSFAEYVIAKMLNVGNKTTVPGILLAMELER